MGVLFQGIDRHNWCENVETELFQMSAPVSPKSEVFTCGESNCEKAELILLTFLPELVIWYYISHNRCAKKKSGCSCPLDSANEIMTCPSHDAPVLIMLQHHFCLEPLVSSDIELMNINCLNPEFGCLRHLDTYFSHTGHNSHWYSLVLPFSCLSCWQYRVFYLHGFFIKTSML